MAENDRPLDETARKDISHDDPTASDSSRPSSSPSRSTPATGRSTESPPQSDLLDDVFDVFDVFDVQDSVSRASSLQLQEPSDIPRLRSVHTTAGYRDGIAAARTAALQPGFDEGYVLGAALGLRSGYLLGIIEGVLAGLSDESPEQARINPLLDQAQKELALSEIMSTSYMNPDGTWKWPLATEPNAREEDDETTINHVADSHPSIQKWTGLLAHLMKQAAVNPGLHR